MSLRNARCHWSTVMLFDPVIYRAVRIVSNYRANSMKNGESISVRGLSKRFRRPRKEPGLRGAIRHVFRPTYDTISAVNDVTFDVQPGESVGYVGPNGAGKSTTIKMLTGVLHPTAGTVRVLGVDPFTQRIQNARNIGVVVGQRSQLWMDIPVIDSYNLLARVYALDRHQFGESLSELTDVFGLESILGVSPRKLSLGQRMRADLAAALLHAPAVLYLDEPTVGLDIEVKDRMRAHIRHVVESARTTVVLTSHDLGDITQLCSRVIVVDDGTVIRDSTMADLAKLTNRTRTVEVSFTRPVSVGEDQLRNFEWGRLAKVMPGRVTVTFPQDKYTAYEIARALEGIAEVADVRVSEPNLESVVESIYRMRRE